MQLRYDEDFVEGAVFICARLPVTARTGSSGAGQARVAYATRTWSPPRLQIARFHRERERLYAILDPDERNAAFFTLHLEWFREWGLEKTLLDLVAEFSLLRQTLGALVFRKARVKSDEGTELYVNAENGRTGVVALRVERFAQPEELARFLRHEFMHVHDMVNPAFGYSPQLHLPDQNAAQQRLTRERYRLLWDITIDGRIASGTVAAAVRRRNSEAGHKESPPPYVGGYNAQCEQHRAAFDRAFGFWPEHKRDDVFDSLRSHEQPHHEELLALAADPREIKLAHEPTPGAPCPLCGFATFDWADCAKLSGKTAAAIQHEFPHWSPEQGACGRCVEIYRAVGSQSLVTI